MSDLLDRRIRLFVEELLEDAPPAPPFPQPGMVVVRSDDPTGREHMLDTKRNKDSMSGEGRSRRGRTVGALAFAAVLAIALLIGAVLFVAGDDVPPAAPPTTAAPATPDEGAPPPEGAAALVGQTARASGLGTRPDRIEFGTEGGYVVTDLNRIVDTGTYTIDGDEIVFVSDATEGVRWFVDDLNPFTAGQNTCDGVEGRYVVEFDSATHATLRVISDACLTRNAAANRLELDLIEP